MSEPEKSASKKAAAFGILGGPCRAAVELEIRKQVRIDFAAEWNASSIWRRVWLRIKLEVEIKRRTDKKLRSII